MAMILREKAEYLATLRWLEVFLMETLARWVPTTPEMEVKVLMGRHIWDAAQHADALGKRTFELRAPLHYTLTPLSPYLELMKEIASVDDTPGRIQAIYDVLLPTLTARYQQYLEGSDSLLDEPSFRVLHGILSDYARMRAESDALREELKATLVFNPGRVEEWRRKDAKIREIVPQGSGATLAVGAHA